jgi:predicted nucleic-acid-binding Zn-ribbon protein
MKKSGVCPKCSCVEIIKDAKVLDKGHYSVETELQIATDKNPEALWFKGRKRTNVSAWVCTECGYIEFYADAAPSIADT